MRRLATTALLLGLGFAGALVAPAPAEEGDQLDPLASITAAEYLDHVKWLADDARGGRLTGTADERAATEYVAQRFEAWGLKPGGKDGSWYQYFDIPSRAAMGEGNGLRIGEQALQPGTDFRPVSRAPKASAEGEFVWAGWGVSDAAYDDYTGLDCKGKIVVALRASRSAMPPGVQLNVHPFFAATALLQMQVKAAKEAGAVGLVLLPNSTEKDEVGIVPGGGRRSRAMSRNPIPFPVVIATRSAFAAHLRAAGVELGQWEAETKAAGVPQQRAPLGVQGSVASHVVSKEYQGRNVIGVLEGVDPELKKEVVVIGAHADHVGRNEAGNARDGNNEIHNGADDNASGTAGMLEVAQAFATCAYRPKRTIVFCAFTGEELGLIGSSAYCKEPTFPIADTIAMINLDMIGRSKDGKVVCEATDSSPGFKALVTKHNKVVDCTVAYPRGVKPDSDHYPFIKAGVPALFFFTGLHADYHNATDDWDKINAPDAARIAQLTFLVAAELSAMDGRPEYVKPQLARRGGAPGGDGRSRRARLGVMPDFAYEGVGARVGSAIPESPAAKAGLKAGDVIIRIGQNQVGGLQDLQSALQNHKAGETVEIEIKRGDEKLVLKCTLGRSNR
ncbi:MAG: M20/M25/M40 family metallo-hydrolase [Planctomycetota bacterium]|jgi:hypothetical protein